MRLALAACLLSATAAQAFEPGTFGEAMEETGYFVACATGEGGSACEVHASGAIFMAYSEGPSEPEAMNALAGLAQGSPVKITGDMISMGDVTVDFALNTAAAYPEDPLAPFVAGLQGDWTGPMGPVSITGLEWVEPESEGPSYIGSLGTACADGAPREGTHLSLRYMGGDPFFSICLKLITQTEDRIEFQNAETGEALVLSR